MSKVNALDYAIFRSAIKGENGETLYHVRSRALVGTTDFETICKNIESNAMPKVSDVKGCTEALIEEIAYQVSQNKRAHIDGLGSFYPIIGLAGKKHVSDPKSIRADDVVFKGVGFRPEKSFTERCQNGKSKYQKVAEVYNTTINESTLRMELKKYLDENKFITAKNFCRLFCVSYRTARKILDEMVTAEFPRLIVKTAGKTRMYFPIGE